MIYEQPIATVDVALFTLSDARLCVLLGRRGQAPHAGEWALPGGYVHTNEDQDTADSARRILRDKTPVRVSYLEQLYTFSGRGRDPRGWSISVAYYALVPVGELGVEQDDELCLLPVAELPALPFDHRAIIDTAVARLGNKSAYSSLPTYLLPAEFTLAELKQVYEQVMATELDRTSFRRNMLAQGVVESVEGVTRGGAHRPAQVFRRCDDGIREFDRSL